MSVVEQTKPAGLVPRVIGILTRPKAEWDVVAGEAASVQGLFMGYAAILALLPAIGQLINGFLPHCVFGVCVTSNPVFVVIGAAVSYVISLLAVFVVGLIIDALAPSFGGEKNQIQAMKVAVYSWTAAWIAGIFVAVPWVGGLLALAGLYSFYLLFVGLPKLMKSPPDKSVGYVVVVIVLGIVISVVAAAIGGAVIGLGTIGAGGLTGGPQLSGTLHVGNGSVDLGRLQGAAQQAAAQAQAAQNGQLTAVDPEKLKGLLPATVGGAPRTEISAVSVGQGGLGSNAEATYEQGDVHVTLTITDLAAASGLASLAGAINVQEDKQTATGYERASNVNGRWTVEQYDNQSKSGKYSILVGNRFNVAAEGSGVSMDVLKAAVAAVGPDRLEALSHG
jgi:hypothetical protein